MKYLRSINCCGGGELVGINDRGWSPKEYVQTYQSDAGVTLPSSGLSFVVMSYAWDVGRDGDDYRTIKQGRKRFKDLKAYIKKHKLGTLEVMSKSTINPNHGTTRIRAAVWVIDNPGVFRLAVKEGWIKRRSYDDLLW